MALPVVVFLVTPDRVPASCARMAPRKLALGTPSKKSAKKKERTSKSATPTKLGAAATPTTKKQVYLVAPSKARVTPVKRSIDADFFTPSTPKRQSRLKFTNKEVTPSPKTRGGAGSGVVIDLTSETTTTTTTATTATAARAAKKSSRYVPTAIYKNIQYSVRTDDSIMKLSVPRRLALTKILELVEIPDDFETRKFGPLSGTCWEERVLNCYDSGLLKSPGGKEIICTSCASEEHRRNDCPLLL